MKVVQVDNLAVGFQGLKVFSGVSFQVLKGQFVAVVGPNGSGKSVLLRAMAKMVKPLAGEIELFGENLKTFRGWQKIAYIAQTLGQQNKNFPVLVEEVVAMGLVVGKKNALPFLGLAEKKKIGETLQAVGMEGQEKEFFGTLSGGQKQKILLARALITDCQLLLLDEPTSGIDADAKEDIYSLLKKVKKEKETTIIMVSHDMELAAQTADKVLCLEKGSVCYWGEAQRLRQHRHKSGQYFACLGQEETCGNTGL